MKKVLIVALWCLAFSTASVNAEIQQVTIRWTSLLCKESCVKTLDRELKKVKGVDQVTIDQGGGQAVITWKANVPFQFTSINTAMHMVGLSMRDIRIRVRGTIQPSGNLIFITSEGDNTRFELVNPATPNPKGQTSVYNYASRTLSPALRQQLLEGYQEKKIATIEGPVFMPERMAVPTQIVVDRLNFAVPETPVKKG